MMKTTHIMVWTFVLVLGLACSISAEMSTRHWSGELDIPDNDQATSELTPATIPAEAHVTALHYTVILDDRGSETTSGAAITKSTLATTRTASGITASGTTRGERRMAAQTATALTPLGIRSTNAWQKP